MAGFYKNHFSDEQFLSRTKALIHLAECRLENLISQNHHFEGKIFISYSNIEIAVGRYANDVNRLKSSHNFKRFHPSKMIAHMVKWVHLNPVLFSSFYIDELSELDKIDRLVVRNINYLFINDLVEYFLEIMRPNIPDEKYQQIFYSLEYYLKTGSYNERIASLWFEEIIIGG